MKPTLYLIAHEHVIGGPLEHPVVAATVSTDPDIVGTLDVHKLLTGLAGRLGLTGFEISHGDPTYVPGHQYSLPLPKGRKKCGSKKQS